MLKGTPLFADWAIADVKAVASQMRARTFAPGTRICTEGDRHAEEFFIITSGSVRVVQSSSGSSGSHNDAEAEIEVRVLTEFDSFGLAALTCGDEGAVRTASCVAVNHVEMLVLYRNDFQEELDKVEVRKRTARISGMKESGGSHRRGSVRDALGAVADASMQGLHAEDETRRAAARTAVAEGVAPAPPPLWGGFSSEFVVDDGDDMDTHSDMFVVDDGDDTDSDAEFTNYM